MSEQGVGASGEEYNKHIDLFLDSFGSSFVIDLFG